MAVMYPIEVRTAPSRKIARFASCMCNKMIVSSIREFAQRESIVVSLESTAQAISAKMSIPR